MDPDRKNSLRLDPERPDPPLDEDNDGFGFMLPLLVALALILIAGHYLYNGTTAPAERTGSAVTRSEPRPN
jgi:hypothetical protein